MYKTYREIQNQSQNFSLNTSESRTSGPRLQANIPYEPQHVKTNKSDDSDQPEQTVWSESLLCTKWVVKDPSFLHADREDSDRTRQMPRLIWVFAGRTCHFVGFVMRRLISNDPKYSDRCWPNSDCYWWSGLIRVYTVCNSVCINHIVQISG